MNKASLKDRDEIRDKLVDAFSSLDSVYLIHEYGSGARADADQYSDIDIVVYSHDLAMLSKDYTQLIEDALGSILMRVPFPDEQESEISDFMILKNFSPYQRIDLNIIPSVGYIPGLKISPIVRYEDKGKEEPLSSKSDPVIPKYEEDFFLRLFMFNFLNLSKSFQRKSIYMQYYFNNAFNDLIALIFNEKEGFKKTKRLKIEYFEELDLYKRIKKDEHYINLFNSLTDINNAPLLIDEYKNIIERRMHFYGSEFDGNEYYNTLYAFFREQFGESKG